MNPKLSKLFGLAAGLILIAMATAEVIGNQGAVIIQPADPLLGISSRYLFWALVLVESAVAAVCLFCIGERFKCMTVFWLTSYLVLFRACLYCIGVHSIGIYFGTMAVSFGLSPGAMGLLFSAGVDFLWCGSGALLFVPGQIGDKELRRQLERSSPSANKVADPKQCYDHLHEYQNGPE